MKPMDAIDRLGELVKGEARGGKYFRRVATGNPKRPWRYFYTKEAYEREHGDKAHRNGEEERKLREEADRAAQRADDLTARHGPGDERAGRAQDRARAAAEALDAHRQRSQPTRDQQEAEYLESPRGQQALQAEERRNARRKKPAPVKLGALDAVSPTPASRADNGGDDWLYQRQRGSTKSMQPTMSKGLMSFQEPYGEGKKLARIQDDWLPDYVDAFLEEAYEHERVEAAHRDPNLIEPGTDPADALVTAVYNEFIAYCAQNPNLARAKTSIPVTKEYVAARLNELGHLHVNTENHNANAQAAVAGYYPTRMALSEDGHAAAEQERDEMIRRLGALSKAEDHVVLADDGENPMDALAGAMEHHAESFHGVFGAQSPVSTHDADCPFHGRDLHKSGIEVAVHGVHCTCK